MRPNESGVHEYFRNLRMYSEAADEAGIDPWTTLLCVPHFDYRCPSEDDLRWQLNTAVASGMKGILWFYIYLAMPMGNYRLAPIDEFGERTEMFTHLSRVNRHFLHQFGDFFRDAKHIATYHMGKTYGGYEAFEPGETDDTVLNVTCDQGLNGVIGFFEKDGEKYLVLVNNSWTDSGLFKIHVPKSVSSFARLGWHGDWWEMSVYAHDAYYKETETEYIGGDWMAPGQLKVYRIG